MSFPLQRYVLLSVCFIICIKQHTCANHRCTSSKDHLNRLQFGLVRRCQRSSQNIIELENTQSIEECFAVAKRSMGLALNYAPVLSKGLDQDVDTNLRRSYKERRSHFWQQPEEFFNCHVLECPENATFKTMVNDSRFDYYSLYGTATDSKNYSCIAEVGLFQLYTSKKDYFNASMDCYTTNEILAHVASEQRTNGLTKVLIDYNKRVQLQRNDVDYVSQIHLAYVGLHMNRTTAEPLSDFQTSHGESLKCYLHRSWAPGHPRKSGNFQNTSCVAISTSYTWVSVECEMELPFICEIRTSVLFDSSSKNVDSSQENMSSNECRIIN